MSTEPKIEEPAVVPAVVVAPVLAIPDVHVKPAIASVIPAVIGALSIAFAFFHSGTLPSSVEVSAVLGGMGGVGAGATLFLAHYRQWLKMHGPAIEAGLAQAKAAESLVPGLTARIEASEASVDAKVTAAVAQVAPAIDTEALYQQFRARLAAEALPPAPVAAPVAAA